MQEDVDKIHDSESYVQTDKGNELIGYPGNEEDYEFVSKYVDKEGMKDQQPNLTTSNNPDQIDDVETERENSGFVDMSTHPVIGLNDIYTLHSDAETIPPYSNSDIVCDSQSEDESFQYIPVYSYHSATNVSGFSHDKYVLC